MPADLRKRAKVRAVVAAARAYIKGPPEGIPGDNSDKDAEHNERDRLYWRLLEAVRDLDE